MSDSPVQTDRTVRPYAVSGLVQAVEAKFAEYPLEQTFSAGEFAGFDQLHTRGLDATVEFAREAGITQGMRVLDLGSGVGGPARFLAETYACRVTGLDATPDFVDAARLLTARSRVKDSVDFIVGDACATPFADQAFDLVWMQHVAMNIEHRDRLYSEVRRILRPGGRFATYDVVSESGELHYPTPWAPSASASFVLTLGQTQAALEAAGLHVVSSRLDTPAALAWLAAIAQSGGPPASPVLAAAFGGNLQAALQNLGRNYREGRIDVVAIIAQTPG